MMKRKKYTNILLKVLITLLFAFIALAGSAHFPCAGDIFGSAYVYAQDDWKNEFDAICSRTDDAMSLSKDELKDLVARCDKLKPLIEKLDETEKKVYLRRLQLCRDLLNFVLESKEKN